MAYNTLLVEKQDGVATLTLNRPDRLNALNTEIMVEMLAALEEI